MIDPLAMPVFKPLWEAFPYLPGCFAAWRGMSLGEISASAYATADGERRPSDAIVDCMAKHAARSLGNDVGEAVKRYFSRNSAVLSANLHGPGLAVVQRHRDACGPRPAWREHARAVDAPPAAFGRPDRSGRTEPWREGLHLYLDW